MSLPRRLHAVSPPPPAEPAEKTFVLRLAHVPAGLSGTLSALRDGKESVVRSDGLLPQGLSPGEERNRSDARLALLAAGFQRSGDGASFEGRGPPSGLPRSWAVEISGAPALPPFFVVSAEPFVLRLESTGEALDFLAARHEALRDWFEKGGLPAVRAKKAEDGEKLAELREICARLPDAQPEGFVGSLRDYQKSGLSWLRFVHNMNQGGVLADQMGIGKTAQLIALLCSIKSDTRKLRALVVAPTSVVSNWAREMSRFAPSLLAHVWHGPKRRSKEAKMRASEVILTSYALLRGDEDLWKEMGLDLLVLDESQYVKNPRSSAAQVAKRIPARCKICATGTPVENRLADLWSLFDICSPGLLDSLPSFTKRYAQPIASGDRKASAALKRVIHPFLLRRTKAEVLSELPAKIETDFLVEMSEVQKKIYAAALVEVRRDIFDKVKESGIEKSQMHILSSFTLLRQIAADPRLVEQGRAASAADSGKLLALQQIVEECLEGGEKVLIFSQFVRFLKLIRKSFDEDEIPYEYLDGETQHRDDIVQRFQSPGGKPVFLISLKAGGSGLNLTAASTVVLADPWFNPAVEDQATDRAHRMGQKTVVNVFRLVAEGTIEEKILTMKGRKRTLASAVLQEDAGAAKVFSRADLEELLS